VIPDEAVEAAARDLAVVAWGQWEYVPNELRSRFLRDARICLEAAAPHLLSHEREQTRLAHLDAMVNRETKQAELAAAWEDGHLMGWNEATANTLPERDSLWRNPYRKPTNAV